MQGLWQGGLKASCGGKEDGLSLFVGDTVDGRNPAPLGNHRKALFLVCTGESSFQGFLGGAGLRPSAVLRENTGLRKDPAVRSSTRGYECQPGVLYLLVHAFYTAILHAKHSSCLRGTNAKGKAQHCQRSLEQIPDLYAESSS